MFNREEKDQKGTAASLNLPSALKDRCLNVIHEQKRQSEKVDRQIQRRVRENILRYVDEIQDRVTDTHSLPETPAIPRKIEHRCVDCRLHFASFPAPRNWEITTELPIPPPMAMAIKTFVIA